MIYLDGNSLGALPVETPAALERVARGEWGKSLIGGWNAHGWITAPQRVGALIAPLIGARPSEVIACDSHLGETFTRPPPPRWRCGPVGR